MKQLKFSFKPLHIGRIRNGWLVTKSTIPGRYNLKQLATGRRVLRILGWKAVREFIQDEAIIRKDEH